jgi:DNA end-binding protein Ku
MACLLRYSEEMRDSAAFSSSLKYLKSINIDKQQLAMATQLIESYSRPFKLEEYKDDYEAALRELVNAKRRNAPLPLEAEQPRRGKVVNLMDALRESLTEGKHLTSAHKRSKASSKKGPVLVGQSRRKRKAA